MRRDQTAARTGKQAMPLLLGLLLFSAPFMCGQDTFQASPVAETYRAAYDAGYADGFEAGRRDRGENHLFDFANNRLFQAADRGRDPQRHDREVYAVAYRRGFEDGYEEGYALTVSPSRRPRVDSDERAGIYRRVDRIPGGTRVKVELRDTLSTAFNSQGDTFRAVLTEDVRAGNQIVIPRGTEVGGVVALVKRAGRIRGRAQINLKFDELRFLDGRWAEIEAKVVDIESQSSEQIKDDEGTLQAPGSKGADVKRIGTVSAVGAVIGLIAAGQAGAVGGATAGAAAGLATILTSRGRDAQLESRTQLTIELVDEAEVKDPNP